MNAHATVAEPTILDGPEQRFPLSMAPKLPRVRDLFAAATKNQWDPQTDIDWDLLDPAQFSEAQLWGARHYWSRRAWGEYGAISESPALQIRYCLQDYPADMRLFFTIRSQEESRHAEVCYLIAEKLGGYIEKPEAQGYEGSVATHGVRKMALDPDVSLEAIIAALVCAAEEIAFDVFKHLIEITPNPVARQVCQAIMRDEVRHCAFGWQFMNQRTKEMSPAELEVIRDAVVTMIEKVECNGYHSSWLAPDSPGARFEIECDRHTWEAGLGATVEELEKPIFVESVKRIRRQMRPWGIELPLFHHPKIGEF
ncbi:MAG: ferritin-like domain-containing protein [Alphaproteobacteria bacterium]|nr:ferritin-like domain-containing protein [Alphaproteobacteria bacterium]